MRVGRPRLDLLFRPVILIYQLPKTGSQTIEATLQTVPLPHAVFRLHYLTRRSTKDLRSGLAGNAGGEQWRRDVRYQLTLRATLSRVLAFRKILRSCGLNIPKIDIITGVREIIGLALASIFENYRYFVAEPESMTVETVLKILTRPGTCRALQEWFDQELRRSTGIDVYATPFPSETGYSIVENRFARVLLYRFEALEHMPKMLGAFLGCSAPRLVACNLGEEKPYAAQYRQVKSELRLAPEFVDEQLSSRLMRHFYSSEERQRFRAKWCEPEAMMAPQSGV